MKRVLHRGGDCLRRDNGGLDLYSNNIGSGYIERMYFYGNFKSGDIIDGCVFISRHFYACGQRM